MNLILTTSVDQKPDEVKAGFNEDLFLSLSPPFPKVELLRFDGSETGDIVSLQLNLLINKQTWTSEITDHGETAAGSYFIDEGIELPFPLKIWKHKHILESSGSGTNIVDNIEFSTKNAILDVLIYPFMWLQFAYRKPIYRRIFGNN